MRIPTKSMLENLLQTHSTERFSVEGMRSLRRFGLIDEDGNIIENAIIDMLENRY